MMVTFNRLDLTKLTLTSLLETAGYNFNLLLVDNASTDGTVEYLKKFCQDNKGKNWFQDYRICPNPVNLGIATGRNQALVMSNQLKSSDWLCCLDNDVILPHNWLKEAVEILSANSNYGAIGVNLEGNKYPEIQLNNKTFQNKARGNLGTACMVFPRNLHKMLGFFNNIDYSPFYGLEDSDFGMRVRVLGLKMGYILESGNHLGVGNADQGEYRKFKTKEHDGYLKKFNENCAAYHNKTKSLYFSFK